MKKKNYKTCLKHIVRKKMKQNCIRHDMPLSQTVVLETVIQEIKYRLRVRHRPYRPYPCARQ